MKRTRLDIIKDILEVSSKKGGARKTKIRYIVGTFDQFNRYVPVLEEKGFIYREGNNGSVKYKTSERGIKFLKEYEQLNKLMTTDNISIN